MIENREDRLQTLLPALTPGIATASFIIAKTGRDALFFQGSGGLLQLPLVYINIGAASLPLALIFVKAMKVWGARSARVGLLLLAAVVMALSYAYILTVAIPGTPGVSWMGHLGGLIGGVASGWIFRTRRGQPKVDRGKRVADPVRPAATTVAVSPDNPRADLHKELGDLGL